MTRRRRSRTALAALAVAAPLVLAACGGDPTASADEAPEPTVSASVSPSPTPSPTVTGLPGTPANADLSDLLCARDASGQWVASGTLTNPTSSPADYRVSVAVASPSGGAATARRLVLPKVAPGTPTPVRLDKLPVTAGDSPTCRVQVLRLS